MSMCNALANLSPNFAIDPSPSSRILPVALSVRGLTLLKVASFPLLRRADSSRASADASRNARVLAGAIPRGIPSQAAAPGGVRHREPTVMPAAGGTHATFIATVQEKPPHGM